MRMYESREDEARLAQAERDAEREDQPYSPRWADLTLPKQTIIDSSLDHQVVIYVAQRGQVVHVSCNCLIYRAAKDSFGAQSHVSMGITHNIEESRALYNDPALHKKPFTEEDRARW